MISNRMKRFFEEVNLAFVASADQEGNPHLAAGRGLQIPEPDLVVFEAWFCQRTLANVGDNPKVALVILDQSSGHGYQLIGTVKETSDVALLNGFAPDLEEPGLPQVQSRMTVRIDRIMEFSHGIHSDHPLPSES